MQSLKGIFPADSVVPARLIKERGHAEALRIGRAAARRTKNLIHRENYAVACIENPLELEEHRNRLEKNPHLADLLDGDELRALPAGEYESRAREVGWREDQIAILTGQANGLQLLSDAIGRPRAWAHYCKLFDYFSKDGRLGEKAARLMNDILVKGSQARLPDRYIDACLKNEKDRPRKSRKRPAAAQVDG
jgi:hypothetical protein